MRKRLILYAIIFILAVFMIKCSDIVIRYDIDITDYVRYSMPLSDEERSYLRSNGLRYGVDMMDSPYAFISDESGQATGILIDYFNQLAIALETDLRTEVYDNYNLPIKLKSEDMEMAVLNRNDINNSVFEFTQTLYTERSKVLVNGEAPYDNISDINNISIAVISGSAAHHAANKFFTPSKNVEIILTDGLDESLTLLGLGKVDAIIGDEAKISYHLNQALRHNWFKFVEGSISEEDVAIAVNKTDKLLLNILNKGILIMKENDQYNHINSKWFGSFIPEINEGTSGAVTANVLAAAVILFGIFFIWNKSVANKVSIRTRELNESRQALRDLIDSLDMGIMVTDSSGVVTAVNRTLIDLFGAEYNDYIGKRRDEIEELEPFILRANDKDAFFYNGKYYLIYSRKLSEDSPNDILLIDDYTDRQRYERLNRQEAKMIAVGELTAGLTHEIRNPLGLIKSYIYVLKKKISDENGQHAVQVMDESVNRINKLIENLLGFSKLSADTTELIDIRQSVISAIELEKDELDKHNIELSTEFDLISDDKIRVNEDVIKLSIVNLTKNSIDAFEECDREHKELNISVRTEKNTFELIFEDNAAGIPNDKLDQIFDPFFTTKDSGTGLGLYILQSEIRKSGGSLTVDSIENERTTFKLSLPVEEDIYNA